MILALLLMTAALDSQIRETIQAYVALEGVSDPARRSEVEADKHWTTDETGRVHARDKALERKEFKADPAAAEKAQAQLKTIGLHYDPPEELVAVQLAPDLAWASYRLVQHTLFNGEPCTKVFRYGEVFRRENGRWKSAMRQETIIPGAPRRYPADVKAYADYAGQYVLFPGHTYRVTRDGDRLLWGNVEKGRVELVPEDDHTFVMNGREYYRVRFERDPKGAVTHLRMIEFPGVEYSAIKQPDSGVAPAAP